MNEDQINFIKDTLKSEGWKLLKHYWSEQKENYRKLATQAPESVSDQKRTWYSGKAEGIEEVINGSEGLVQ